MVLCSRTGSVGRWAGGMTASLRMVLVGERRCRQHTRTTARLRWTSGALPEIRGRAGVSFMPPDAPLTLDRVLAAAEDVIRPLGPSKATVVDVARALGVSHTAVHKHVGSKAGLRDMVVGRWVEATMPPLRAIAAERGPAPKRLRKLIDALIAVKRRRATGDPE